MRIPLSYKDSLNRNNQCIRWIWFKRKLISLYAPIIGSHGTERTYLYSIVVTFMSSFSSRFSCCASTYTWLDSILYLLCMIGAGVMVLHISRSRSLGVSRYCYDASAIKIDPSHPHTSRSNTYTNWMASEICGWMDGAHTVV